jgi:perosamine synthetase
MIPISKPLIGEEERMAVSRTLESGLLAQGPRVAEFERAFANFIGVEHAIATANGTMALHAALLAHGIGPGDEVITTPFTFIASVNAILYVGARPVFVDIDDSFNINAQLIEAAITERTRAILPVHLYGQPVDLDIIGDIARRHGLILIEDACQAHGAEFSGRRVGSFGTGCFSFYATKNMTTGEGGIITMNDADAAARARSIISHGMRVRYYHDTLGYNYRMTDIAAAIGIEQLKKLPAFNARRADRAVIYNDQLAAIPGLITPHVRPGRTHVFHQYTIRIAPDCTYSRDALVEVLQQQGIGAGIYYPVPVHRQSSIQAIGLGGGMFPVAEQMAVEVLSLPIHPGVTDIDQMFIIDSLSRLCLSGALAA